MLLLCALSSPVLAAEQLCPDRVAAHPQEEALLIPESAFTFEAYEMGMSFIGYTYPETMHNSKTVLELLDHPHSIGYHHHLSLVEGYVLKQQALLHRAVRDLVPSARRAAAHAAYIQAKNAFCEFLNSTFAYD